MFEVLPAVGDELAGDGDGILHGLFTKNHIAVVHKEHVEVHYPTGAAVQGVSVLPACAIAVVRDSNDFVTRHSGLIDLQRLVIVCIIGAKGYENGVVENQAVGVGSYRVATGLFHAIHLIGIAPAAVGGSKVVCHRLVVIVMAVGLGQFGN